MKSAERWPNRPSLGAVGTDSKTFTQTVADAATWSSWIQALGLEKGDRVVILAESREEWGAAYFGVTAAGFVAVPILPDFAAQQISNILEHSEAKAAISSSKLGGVLESAISMSENIPDDIPRANLESRVVNGGIGKGCVLGEPDRPRDMFEIPLRPDDIAVILYTSGTTGTSKGVTLTHSAIAWNAHATLAAGLGTEPEDVRHLSVLPLAHTYECTIGLVGILSVGGEVKYLDGPPTPSRLIKAMEEVKPTVMLTVPILMEKIFRSRIAGPMKAKPALKFLYGLPPARKAVHRIAGSKVKKLFGGNLRFFGIGGAPLPQDVERFLVESRFPYSVGYGLTETAPLLAGGAASEMKFRSTGKILPGVSIRISDPNEKGVGEIQAKGPSVMSGYWKDPERTAEVFTEDGWFRTGDLGSLDGEYLYIKGRLKDVILGSNGENIYPDEVESVINGHNFVAESIAYLKDGNLVARILLDAEKIAAEAKQLGLASAEKVAEWKRDLLERTRYEANKQLGRNAKISAFIEQIKPFEKTPSLKIKRFLYTGPRATEA